MKPIQATILRRTMADKINREAENKYAHEKLEPTPETVSATSTMNPVFEPGTASAEREVDMMAGVKNDLVCRHVVAQRMTNG
jgi:hypothetical protein